MPDRPNVLMLVTDNQSADSLGCYGNSEHETPRLDRLARKGAQFLRAFCTNGLCSPTSPRWNFPQAFTQLALIHAALRPIAAETTTT
jgi:hypothetical protein